PLRLAFHAHQEIAPLLLLDISFEQELLEPENRCDGVSDLVREARRQTAHRGETLRTEQRFLCAPALLDLRDERLLVGAKPLCHEREAAAELTDLASASARQLERAR